MVIFITHNHKASSSIYIMLARSSMPHSISSRHSSSSWWHKKTFRRFCLYQIKILTYNYKFLSKTCFHNMQWESESKMGKYVCNFYHFRSCSWANMVTGYTNDQLLSSPYLEHNIVKLFLLRLHVDVHHAVLIYYIYIIYIYIIYIYIYIYILYVLVWKRYSKYYKVTIIHSH